MLFFFKNRLSESPIVNQILESLDEMQYLSELNEADVASVQSIFEDKHLHALLTVRHLTPNGYFDSVLQKSKISTAKRVHSLGFRSFFAT